jgi:hypothetical protein
MTRWEYLELRLLSQPGRPPVYQLYPEHLNAANLRGGYIDVLTLLGADGWEVATVATHGQTMVWLLKRHL